MILLFSIDKVCHVCHKRCLDTFSKHMIHYKELLGVKYRHDFVKDVLFDIFRQFKVSVKKVTHVNLFTDPYKGRSTLIPTYVMVYDLVGEKHACMNLTRVFPLVGLRIESLTIGKTFLKNTLSKVVKYEKTCYENQHCFIPFAFKTFDSLSSKTFYLLRKVQKLTHNNIVFSMSMNVVFKRINFTIHKR